MCVAFTWSAISHCLYDTIVGLIFVLPLRIIIFLSIINNMSKPVTYEKPFTHAHAIKFSNLNLSVYIFVYYISRPDVKGYSTLPLPPEIISHISNSVFQEEPKYSRTIAWVLFGDDFREHDLIPHSKARVTSGSRSQHAYDMKTKVMAFAAGEEVSFHDLRQPR